MSTTLSRQSYIAIPDDDTNLADEYDAIFSTEFDDFSIEDLSTFRQLSVADELVQQVSLRTTHNAASKTDEDYGNSTKQWSLSHQIYTNFALNPSISLYSSNQLFLLCLFYTFSAASENWLINWFKECGVNLPIYFTILQNCAWPLQLVGYYKIRNQLNQPRIITREMLKNYIILGLLSSFINLSRMFGLSVLSPIVYIICSNSEIVFETLLTKVLLKKNISTLQMLAVCLVILAVPVSIYDPETNSFNGGGDDDGEDDSQDSNGSSYLLLGIALSLGSRLASSLNTILAEKFLGVEKKTKIGVSEAALANSIIPFFTIPFALVFIDEYTLWPDELAPTLSKTRMIIALLSVTLCISKQIDRISKFGIVQGSNTLFFAGVDSLNKIIAGLGSFIFFSEEVTISAIFSFVMIGISVLLLYLDKRNKMIEVQNYFSTVDRMPST